MNSQGIPREKSVREQERWIRQMKPLLQVEDLTIAFMNENKQNVVVEDVNFSINSGEIVSIVGESGCGKSVTALSILGLLSANARVIKGRILFEGKDLLDMNEKELDKIRGNEVAMIFQDVMNSLNPVLTIGNQLTESVRIHLGYDKKKAKEYAIEII